MTAKNENVDKDKLLEQFLRIGLDERTARNTVANNKVTANLNAVIHEVFSLFSLSIKKWNNKERKGKKEKKLICNVWWSPLDETDLLFFFNLTILLFVILICPMKLWGCKN